MATIRPAGGTCLLVIDLQKDVVAQAFDRDGVLSRTATLIDRARSEAVPVVFVQHEEEDDLVRGTPGWQFADEIVPLPGDPVVAKEYRDSFAATTLAALLAERNIARLVIAGAASDYCIRTTTQRAAAEGYDVTLVQDCHTTDDTEFDGVKVTGEQIVAHTNKYFQWLNYPGQTFGIATHDKVTLSG